MNQDAGLPQTGDLWHVDLETPRLQNWRETHACHCGLQSVAFCSNTSCLLSREVGLMDGSGVLALRAAQGRARPLAGGE